MSNFEIIPATNVGITRPTKLLGDGSFIGSPFEDVDFEFETDIDKASKLDYGIAAGSGLITGLLSIFLGKPLSIAEAEKIGKKEADKIVLTAAKALGYNLQNNEALFDKDGRCNADILAKAIKFLEGKYPIPQDKLTPDFGGGLQHHLRDFSHHPTILGLFFSILGQFTETGYGTDTNGCFIRIPFPSHALVGKNVPEKIAIGTINWLFHLISDLDGSSQSAGKGTGIPGPILSLMKEISSTPLLKNVKLNYSESGISFSKWISKLFNGTYFKDQEGKPVRFDFRTEMGLVTQLMEQSLFVLANEVIIRVFYMASRLTNEIKSKNVSSISQLDKLDARSFLPIDNRALTRMCTVSSGTFVAVNSVGSLIKAGVASKGKTAAFATTFFLNINYPGIGRFVVACFFDAQYAKEDVKNAYKKAMKERNEKRDMRNSELQRLSSKYRFLTLNKEQTRLLYAFESMLIAFDILKTKKKEHAQEKATWKAQWETAVCESLDVERDEFFIRSGRQAFSLLENIAKTSDDCSWLDLIILELSMFTPYHQLGTENDRAFKKLKIETDYLSDVFCKGQDRINEKDIKAIKRAYTNAVGTITGKRKKVAVATAATFAATAATAGGALALAPEIAILIAGDAVAGLSGAALTSASLAFVGGGSLAVGGMGMAGGTAILTGGGALIGLAGSGITTTATVAIQSSNAFVQIECAKLLAFCSEIAAKKYGRYDIVTLAHEGMTDCITQLQNEIDHLMTRDDAPDKKLLSQMRKSLKCMTRCNKALLKLSESAKPNNKQHLLTEKLRTVRG